MRAGPWILEERLGSGGMGEVWAATHRRFGHPGAVKRLTSADSRPDDTWTDSAYLDFDREIRAIASLDHPNVVRIFDRGIDPEIGPWLAMERALGPVHTVHVPTSWDALQHVLSGVLRALGAAHAASMLHLDVKPANLLVRQDGSVALADFGIVQLRDAQRVAPGTRWGTPPYMAPERFRGEPLTEATDLYAVGCLAVRLATGHPPFPSSLGWAEAAHHHAQVARPPLVPRFPVPSGLEAWLDGVLAKSPWDRFGSAAAALTALVALQSPIVGRGVHAFVDPDTPPTRSTAITAATAQLPPPLLALPATPAALTRVPVPIPATWPTRPHDTRRLAGLGAGLLGVLHVPFTGRESERARLWQHLHDHTSLLVTGPPGVGRTRLVETFARTAAEHIGCPVVFIDGRAPDPADDAVRRLVDPGDARAVALKLRTADPVDAITDAPSADARLLALIAGLSRDRPALVVLDDVLFQPASLQLAGTLVDRGIPVVLTADDTRRSHLPARLASLETLPLSPLGTEVLRSLLANWVGLDRAVVAEVAALCEGDVPLAVQTIHHGLDTGILEPAESGLQATQAVRLPPRALTRWSSTVDALHVSTQAFDLAVAAACGSTVDAALLGRALGEPRRAEAVQHALFDAGLATPTPEGWRWASTALRLQILARATDLPGAHRAVAAALAGDTTESRWSRGLQLLAAGDLVPAMEDLFATASDRIAQGHMMSAARTLERLRDAMTHAELPESDPNWGELWRAFGILGPTHQGNQATWDYNLRALEAARPYPDQPAWRFILRSTLGGLVWHANVMYRPDLGATYLDEARAHVPPDEPMRAGWWDSRGWHALITGRPARAVESFAQACDLARASGSAHRLNAADGSLAVAKCHAGHADAESELLRAGDAILAAGFLSATADVAAARGDHYRFAGDLAQSRHWYDAMRKAVQEGQARADLLFDVCWALWLRDAGEIDHADHVLEAAGTDLDPMLTSWGALLPIHRLSVQVERGLDWDDRPLAQLDTALGTLVELGLVERESIVSLGRIAAHLPETLDSAGSNAMLGRIRTRIDGLTAYLARGVVEADLDWPPDVP